MTLTKADLASYLVDQIGLTSREAKEMVESFFAEIANALEAGRGVKLAGFGNFDTQHKVARPGRNPKTGIEVVVSARRVVTFHASGKLKSEVEGSAVLNERPALVA